MSRSKKFKIDKKLKNKLLACGLTTTILGGGMLYSFSKRAQANDTKLTSYDGKLHLVDVTNGDNKVNITDINGNEIIYNFDSNTVAVVGAKKGKTYSDCMYEVMLIDGDSNITYGLMDGKYLSNSDMSNVKVLDVDFDKYVVNSDCQLYSNTSASEKICNLNSNQQLIISDREFKSIHNDYIWNEAILVENNQLKHGYVINDNVSFVGTDTIDNGDNSYYINTDTLNVRSVHSKDGDKIDSLKRNTKVSICDDYEAFEDGNYKWVYISYTGVNGNTCYGWVAAVDYTCDPPYNYLVDSSIKMDDMVNAYSAVVFNANTGEVIYGKNENDVLNPASITKILTAYIVGKYGNLNDKLTYSHNALDAGGYKSDGYGLYDDQRAIFHVVVEGNTVSVRDALYMSLLYSENCTTVALAEYIESITGRSFTDIMNEEAKNMGCRNSHFMNPFGAYDENHYVTAVDMAKIMSAIAKENPIAIEALGTAEYSLEYDGTTILNQSKILHFDSPYYIPEAIGCKTGYINESGQTMVSAYEKDGVIFTIVTLEGRKNGSVGKFEDAKLLSDYAFENYNNKVYKKRN